MYNELNNLVKTQLTNQMQQANIAAQQELKQAEISKIRNKYVDDSLFDGFRNELDNYKIQLGHNITNSLKSKEGWTENLNTKVWDKGVGQYNKIINDIDNLRTNIDLTKEQILCCTTLAVADKTYDGIKDVVRIFKSRWINEEKQLIHDWTGNLLELIEKEAPIPPVVPPVPPVNNPPQNQNLEQALKKIQELETLLNQSREENRNLKDNLTIKDNKIEEQANTITMKNNKIEEVSNKNMELQAKLLEKTEKVMVEHDKFIDEHNKFINTKHKVDTHKLKLDNFINHHHVEDQEHLVDMLGDLNIDE